MADQICQSQIDTPVRAGVVDDRARYADRVSIIALPVSPAELVDGPEPTFRWLGVLTWRVWPALFYMDAVYVEAETEAQAKTKAANILGELPENMRCRREPKLAGKRAA